jgi:hypothetical protein
MGHPIPFLASLLLFRLLVYHYLSSRNPSDGQFAAYLFTDGDHSR